jgi:Asp-tRNA(Asn)/Glu-tRNA(Gln) amidotransferase A subunit family amidase
MPGTMNAEMNRRSFLNACSAAGVASLPFANALWGATQAQDKQQQKPPIPPGTAPAGAAEGKGESAHESAVQEGAEAAKDLKLTAEMVRAAAATAGLKFSDAQIEMMLRDLNSRLSSYREIWALKLANSVQPAIVFDPVVSPDTKFETQRRPARLSRVFFGVNQLPLKDLDGLAFYTVRQLGELLRAKKISATNLTEMYLERLKRFDPVLHFVVTLTTDRAMDQARAADRDIAVGRYKGPLHGIPWGGKDLLAVKGYPTTWGAAGFEEQKIEEDATVVKRLDAAGAVLVAKLTLGALAQGDVWFGGVTRNPWKVTQGSSGSSAGPGSATAAGCVGFAIGSETLGSISSPATRNGVTGLRPTFGFVPRTGAMALSWTMDKLGPMARAVEDCAVVLAAIYGPDGQDRSALHNAAFNWDATLDPKSLRVGYVKADFEGDAASRDRDAFLKRTHDALKRNDATLSEEELTKRAEVQWTSAQEQRKFDQAVLDVFQNKLGIKLVSVELPKLPAQAMRPILTAEAATAFDELTRSGADARLTAQTANDWPNTFRESRFIPAVEYINANRARTLLMQQFAEIFKRVDVILSPTFGAQLLDTNLTGHPSVILPNGFRSADNTPTSITFVGDLFGEARMLAVAKSYQDATDFHLKHPSIPTEPTPKFPPDVKLK